MEWMYLTSTRRHSYMSCRCANESSQSTPSAIMDCRSDSTALPTWTIHNITQELVKALDVSSGNIDVQSLVQPLRRLLRVPTPPSKQQHGAGGKPLLSEQTLGTFVHR